LNVQSGAITPGTLLTQLDADSNDAQEFSFEDAGGGFVYIRTHSGNLYVTAEPTLGVKQDVKFPAKTATTTAATDPDLQRWKLATSGLTAADRESFTISNAAIPNKVLQPSGGSKNSGAPVVLGDPEAQKVATQTRNPWTVTSPWLPGGVVVASV
jgi:hypothetical protein